MINSFNFRRIDNKILITNDFGKYEIIDIDTFQQLISIKNVKNQEIANQLKRDFFIIDDADDLYDGALLEAYRDMKAYLFNGTALHIFVLTNTCNMNCVYCQARNEKSPGAGFMSLDTGKKAIDIAMQSPAINLTFEFQGGEPLLNFETMKEMIKYSESVKGNKNINYTIVSNLILLDDDKLDFFKEYNVSVNTSLDGPKILHDKNRVACNDISSYDKVISGVKRLKEYNRCGGAIQTTTRESLKYPVEIVNTYLELGINGLFIRPLSPLGFAQDAWDKIGYSVEDFLSFYEKALNRIIEINATGTVFPESTAVYFLSKILNNFSFNYMELRSPCGAALGQLCYYYDGNIYTCDEGRMVAEAGDKAFKIGNVKDTNYSDIIENPICKTVAVASLTESLPNCSDCVYQPYCGVCPVVTYASEHSIFPKGPHWYRCKINKGILDILFKMLTKDEDGKMRRIFKTWLERG